MVGNATGIMPVYLPSVTVAFMPGSSVLPVGRVMRTSKYVAFWRVEPTGRIRVTVPENV